MKQRERALIIEDVEVNRNLIRSFVLMQGFKEVDVAKDGIEGFDLLVKYKYDVIFLDIKMPIMDGIQFLQQIKKNRSISDISIIMLSASDEIDMIKTATSLGACDYIVKPFTKDKMVKALKNAGF